MNASAGASQDRRRFSLQQHLQVRMTGNYLTMMCKVNLDAEVFRINRKTFWFDMTFWDPNTESFLFHFILWPLITVGTSDYSPFAIFTDWFQMIDLNCSSPPSSDLPPPVAATPPTNPSSSTDELDSILEDLLGLGKKEVSLKVDVSKEVIKSFKKETMCQNLKWRVWIQTQNKYNLSNVSYHKCTAEGSITPKAQMRK